MSTIELSKLHIDQDAAIKEADGIVKELKARRAEIEGQLLEVMAMEGVKNLSVDGMTVYTTTTMRASMAKGEEALEALDLAGGGDIIKKTVNGKTLATWLRDRERDQPVDDGDPISDRFDVDSELARYLNVFDQAHVRVRKA